MNFPSLLKMVDPEKENAIYSIENEPKQKSKRTFNPPFHILPQKSFLFLLFAGINKINYLGILVVFIKARSFNVNLLKVKISLPSPMDSINPKTSLPKIRSYWLIAPLSRLTERIAA